MCYVCCIPSLAFCFNAENSPPTTTQKGREINIVSTNIELDCVAQPTTDTTNVMTNTTFYQKNKNKNEIM
jgi:hypothetical protein